MLIRIRSFFDFFEIGENQRSCGRRVMEGAAARANGMMDLKDYETLAAVLVHRNPESIFEIGTYLGVTADFFLELLPDCRVVSIAFPARPWFLPGKRYNNSELSRAQIGSSVRAERRARFTQLYGDSHRLDSREILRRFGRFDMVFLDGDHTREGVARDTSFARDILSGSGVICWHDANPKGKYRAVREFLEEDLGLTAIATEDEYEGGIACWSAAIGPIIDSSSQSH